MRSKMWSVISGVVVASLLCQLNPASAATEPAVTQDKMGGLIVNWAAQFAFKEFGGSGDSSQLVHAALGTLGCKPGKDYVWGRALKRGEPMQMGDIIQFKSFVIKDGGDTQTLGAPNHTAIFMEEKDGKVLVVHLIINPLGVPPPPGGIGLDLRTRPLVRILGYNFAKKVSGSFIVYRPVLKTSILGLTNELRAQNSVAAVKLSNVLSGVAERYAKVMAEKDEQGHSVDGTKAEERIKKAGYTFAAWAENVAATTDQNDANLAAFELWKNSTKGHRENILNAGFTEMGVGSATSKSGKTYYCQVFAKPR